LFMSIPLIALRKAIFILRQLKKKKIIEEFALIGAVAMGIRGVPRATTDIDFLVKRTKGITVLDMKDHLRQFTPKIFHEGILRFYIREFPVDLLWTSSLRDMKILKETSSLRLSRLGKIRVATLKGIIKMKRESQRLKDKLDIELIEEII